MTTRTATAATPKGRAATITADEAHLWSVYRGHHPRCPPTPGAPALRHLRRLLAEAGEVARVEVYLAWVHESDDRYAQQLRGVEPWPDGEVIPRHDLESLGRHLDGRLLQAEAWDLRGRTTASATGPPRVNGHHQQPPSRMEPVAEGLARFLARHAHDAPQEVPRALPRSRR